MRTIYKGLELVDNIGGFSIIHPNDPYEQYPIIRTSRGCYEVTFPTHSGNVSVCSSSPVEVFKKLAEGQMMKPMVKYGEKNDTRDTEDGEIRRRVENEIIDFIDQEIGMIDKPNGSFSEDFYDGAHLALKSVRNAVQYSTYV